MSEAVTVAQGDTRYSELLAKYLAEGSPRQFEEMGDFGYRRWWVQFMDDDPNPIFFLDAGVGPTSTGYDEATETFKSASWPGPRKGSQIELKDTGIEFKKGSGSGPTGDLKIKAERQPRDISVA